MDEAKDRGQGDGMKQTYLLAAAGVTLSFLIAGCVPRAAPPEPAPAAPIARPMPPPPPPPTVTQPVYDNWMDAPRTPGDWTFAEVAGGGIASYGERGSDPVFALRCDRGAGVIHLDRGVSAGGGASILVRTETADHTFAAPPAPDAPYLRASVPARSPALDAMAFSKGRFAVSVPGRPTLYLPAWPEVTRVIEDCR
jgi:hypothetical protein